MMPDKDFTLAKRNNDFHALMTKTLCTDHGGQRLEIEQAARQIVEQLMRYKKQGGAVYVIGNGGSAAVASHAMTDFANVCGLRAFTLHESSLMTCLSNDFGYEHAFARMIKTMFRLGDVLIAISSSGQSANICNAVKMATAMGGIVITLSGFASDNPLRSLGDLNFWLDSADYGLVEIGHLFILHNLADRIGCNLKAAQWATQQSE